MQTFRAVLHCYFLLETSGLELDQAEQYWRTSLKMELKPKLKQKKAWQLKCTGIVVETPEKKEKPMNTNPKAMIVSLTFSPPQTFPNLLKSV